MTAERLNLVRFAQGSGPLVESFFLKVRLASGCFWARYTFRRPLPGAGFPSGSLWAVLQEADGKAIAGCDTYPESEVAIGRHYLRTGPGELTMGRATGRVGRAPRPIEWDLTFATGVPFFMHFPLAAMYHDRFPGNKVCSPHVITRFQGVVRVGEREFRLDGARGMQGHNWGKGVARSWMFGYCPALVYAGSDNEATDTAFEVVSGALGLGPLTLPPLTMIYFYRPGLELVFNRPDQMVMSRSRLRGLVWEFAGRTGGYQLEGKLSTTPAQTIGLDYVSSDGSSVRCLSSDLADAELRVSGPSLDLRLLAQGTATMELGGLATRGISVPVLVRG